MKPSKDSESEEYLAGFVLDDLSEEELHALDDLATPENAKLIRDLERVAVMAALAGTSSSEPLPDGLRLAVTAAGRALVSERSIRATATTTATTAADLVLRSKYRSLRVREGIAWLACLAASVLALFAWQGNPSANVTRERLIASAPDLIQASWSATKTPLPGNVSGDVVWSNSAQRGFMRFVGMPINDPSVEQYQLWIIDPARDDEPIDGGVFNITSTGESIVPIQAKLAVAQPQAFAITIEKPGGVVVSTQERLPLLAEVRLTCFR